MIKKDEKIRCTISSNSWANGSWEYQDEIISDEMIPSDECWDWTIDDDRWDWIIIDPGALNEDKDEEITIRYFILNDGEYTLKSEQSFWASEILAAKEE